MPSYAHDYSSKTCFVSGKAKCLTCNTDIEHLPAVFFSGRIRAVTFKPTSPCDESHGNQHRELSYNISIEIRGEFVGNGFQKRRIFNGNITGNLSIFPGRGIGRGQNNGINNRMLNGIRLVLADASAFLDALNHIHVRTS